MAHGYAKIEGKPMMIMAHGTVGLQHASMAIYNAYCDRVPIIIIAGNILDVNYRRGNAEWVHSVQDAAAMVRDYTKWDDTPVTLDALRRVHRPRLQDRDDAALRTGGDRGRRRAAGRADHGKESAHSEARDERAAAGRYSRHRRSRAGCWWPPRIPIIVAGRVARTPKALISWWNWPRPCKLASSISACA